MIRHDGRPLSICGARRRRRAFDFDAILAAHRALPGIELTDDSAVAEMAGLMPVVVAGG